MLLSCEETQQALDEQLEESLTDLYVFPVVQQRVENLVVDSVQTSRLSYILIADSD